MPYGDSITITIPAQTPEPVPSETDFMSEIFVHDLTHADIADAFLALKGVGSLVADPTVSRYAFHDGKRVWYEYDPATGWKRARTPMKAISEVVAALCVTVPMKSEFDAKLVVDENFKLGHTNADVAKRRDATRKLRGRWMSAQTFESSLKVAAQSATVVIWDTAFPDYLGLPDCEVVALRSGDTFPNHAEMFITKTTGAQPAAQPSAEWETFVSEICEGDQDLVDGLQLWIGASVYRGNPVNKFHVLYGEGGSGKSTFVNTIQAALGDYANSADPSIFTAQRGSQHPVMLAPFIDAHFTILPELANGALRSDILKAVTGADSISFREMHGRPQTVKPNATLWFTANELPAPTSVDQAIKRRVMVWPMDAIPKRENIGLGATLQSPQHLGGVLRWVLDGAKRYAEYEAKGERLPIPEKVQLANDEYFNEVDTVGAWLEACTVDTGETSAKDLYNSYTEWAEGESVFVSKRRAWGLYMSRKLTRQHTREGDVYPIGILLSR